MPPFQREGAPVAPEITGSSTGTNVIFRPTRDGRGPVAPNLAPNAPFFLKFNPRRWTLLEGVVVPLLGRIPIEGGVGGVDAVGPTGGAKRPEPKPALDHARDRGEIVILHEVDGEGTSYLKYEEVKGGRHHHTKWETTHSGLDVTTCDMPAYVKWLVSLQERKIIPAPERVDIEGLLARVERDLSPVDKDKDPQRHAKLVQDIAALRRILAGEPASGGLAPTASAVAPAVDAEAAAVEAGARMAKARADLAEANAREAKARAEEAKARAEEAEAAAREAKATKKTEPKGGA